MALRATTAAPTVFKPVYMDGEYYVDGGVKCSNPTAVAVHEAKRVFPGRRIEAVVSVGTGGFKEEKVDVGFGWDGILGSIVSAALDGEDINHVMEDVWTEGAYLRINPIIGGPNEFPIDEVKPVMLDRMKRISREYCRGKEVKGKLRRMGRLLRK